jgi:two-component system response regulator AtoC
LVRDREKLRGAVVASLERHCFDVAIAEDGKTALLLLESGASPDLILLDLLTPGIDPFETLREIRAREAEIPVVVLSVLEEAASIAQAMRRGATGYLIEPFEDSDLDFAISEALETRALYAAIWEGEALRRIREVLEQISDTDVTVLIQGESGVGKEIVARAIHSTSTRCHKPFVKVNCAALPTELLESELFGYERGAFTGAHARKHGRFECADRGTIFLDEIGEMSSALQAKLLQVLQDSTFTRLGGNQDIRVDVRVVAATNRHLEEMVAHRGFREDLFFRLNMVNVKIPPLRERRDEIPRLADHFLHRCSAKYGKHRAQISDRLMCLFKQYPFPGNIRELENMIKRIVVLGSEESVVAELLGRGGRGAGTVASGLQSLLEELEQTAGELPLREVGRRASLKVERAAIERALIQTHGNRRRAARMLQMSYNRLLSKIRETGLKSS